VFALTIGRVSGDHDLTALRIVDPITGENVIYNDHADAGLLNQVFTPAIVLDETWTLAEDVITGGGSASVFTTRLYVLDEAAF